MLLYIIGCCWILLRTTSGPNDNTQRCPMASNNVQQQPTTSNIGQQTQNQQPHPTMSNEGQQHPQQPEPANNAQQHPMTSNYTFNHIQQRPMMSSNSQRSTVFASLVSVNTRCATPRRGCPINNTSSTTLTSVSLPGQY